MYEESYSVFEELYRVTNDEEYLIQISWMKFSGLGTLAKYEKVVEELKGCKLTRDLTYAIAGMNYRLENYTEAFFWYEKSLSFGNKKSFFRIGLMYENGFVGEPNKLKAYEYYRKGASVNMFSCRLKIMNLSRKLGFLGGLVYYSKFFVFRLDMALWILMGRNVDHIVDVYTGEFIATRKMKVFPRHP